MRTQPLPAISADAPRLEYSPSGDGSLVRLSVEEFPFIVGRSSAASLPVDSSRVSREHAAIDRRGGSYRLRDLGSTNGTYVNGQRIDETELNDGDLILIADVELTFLAARPTAGATATQVMTSPAESRGGGDWRRLVDANRRLRDALMHGALEAECRPLHQLAQDQPAGWELRSRWFGAALETECDVSQWECSLADHVHRLQRLTAVERFLSRRQNRLLLLSIEAAEIGQNDLLDSLRQLKASAGAETRLVVQMPYSAACDIEHFHDFLRSLEESGLGVAYSEFAGSLGQLRQQSRILPEYLKLAESLVGNVENNEEQRDRLQTLVDGCRELGCEPIATGVAGDRQLEACRQAGIRYVQGPHVGAWRAAEASEESRQPQLTG